jgi:hypothetical protein
MAEPRSFGKGFTEAIGGAINRVVRRHGAPAEAPGVPTMRELTNRMFEGEAGERLRADLEGFERSGIVTNHPPIRDAFDHAMRGYLFIPRDNLTI